ncbi:hypothetical protein [Ideonella paludis]|uniref:hypothetical protein n=1 Tax=Ideonella paludis TaxID=1233411 RepID=UPI0036356244
MRHAGPQLSFYALIRLAAPLHTQGERSDQTDMDHDGQRDTSASPIRFRWVQSV